MLKIFHQNFICSAASCTGDACVTGTTKFYWSYSSSQQLPLELYHILSVNKNMNRQYENCIKMGTSNNWIDSSCSASTTSIKMICEFDNQGLSPTGEFKSTVFNV